MYPYIRASLEIFRHRKAAPLGVGETHVSHHICWPWDIDPWMELNNGRTLTLFDLGRLGVFARTGFFATARANQWGGTVAGSSVRYRRRIRMFDRIEMRSRITGWDHRFTYCEQSLWRKGECASHGLLRIAVVGASGIIPPKELAIALGFSPESPPLPDWITAWTEAEAKRPWPPMDEG
jgi:acyl-CoA thioesterase FadM